MKGKIMTESEQLIAKFVQTAVSDLESHKAAIDRLQENQVAEHKKLQELAELLNEVQTIWTKNFEQQAALLSQQSKFLEALRAIVLPDEAIN